MDSMTMKMDAQYKEFQSHSKQPNPDHNDDDIPMSREEEAKFMQTFRHLLTSNLLDLLDFFLVTLNLTQEILCPTYQPNNSRTPVIFDSDDEDEEPTPQPKPKDPKPVKENPTPKPYKPKVPYTQRLRREWKLNMENAST
ncbi:hypothetical protein Tco_1276735 [Tanacetum coccineum]